MSLPRITHPDTLTPANKLNDVLYAHDHDISGQWPWSEISDKPTIPDLSSLSGYTIQFPSKVHDQDYSAKSQINITGLNGNSDKLYHVVYDGSITLTGEGYFYVLPNASSSDIVNTLNRNFINTRQGYEYTNQIRLIYAGSSGETIPFYGYFDFSLKTGNERHLIGIATCIDNDDSYMFLTNAQWKNISTNLESLRFEVPNGTFTGNITIFKYLDISF